MPKFLINAGAGSSREIQLKPGANIFGRSLASDFPIDEASVSDAHCEIIFADDTIYVKDLDSTNGTFIDGEPIAESFLQPGQSLRLGNVELIYQADSAPLATSASVPLPPLAGGMAVCENHPELAAIYICKKCRHVFCAECINARYIANRPMKFCRRCGDECISISAQRVAQAQVKKTFFQNLPLIFAYPFKRDGWILLIAGTVFFAFMQSLGFFAVFAAGYLCAYMQSLILHSARGEKQLPPWPDFSDWWADILYPYLPMALLAVSMHDTLMALNPLVIILSILKVPLEYLVACLVLGIIVALKICSTMFLEKIIKIPVLTSLVIGFLSLYFLALEMRILGLLYHTKRRDLGWTSVA